MRSSLLATIGFALAATSQPNGHSFTDDVKSHGVLSLKFLDKLPDWDPEQRLRLQLGFDNALDLAKSAMWELQPPGKDALNKNSKIFKKYFMPGDFEIVLGVFKSLLSDSTLGNDKLREVHFANIDLAAICDNPNEPIQPGTIAMYTTPPQLRKPEKATFIVVCPNAWRMGYPKSIHEVKCEETCADFKAKECWPSARMATIGEVILHELIHRTSVLEERPKGLEEAILDQTMKDPDHKESKPVAAYDTYRTQKLVSTGNEKEKARYNADSYAMFAREVWFTTKCSTIPYKDPKHWESGNPNNLKPKPHSTEHEEL